MVVGQLRQESSSHVFLSSVDCWLPVANSVCFADLEPQVIPLCELDNFVLNLWSGARGFFSIVHTKCRFLVFRLGSIRMFLSPGVHLSPSRADVSITTEVVRSFIDRKIASAFLLGHGALAHSAFLWFSFFLCEFLDGWRSRVNEACCYAVLLMCPSYLAVNFVRDVRYSKYQLFCLVLLLRARALAMCSAE